MNSMPCGVRRRTLSLLLLTVVAGSACDDVFYADPAPRAAGLAIQYSIAGGTPGSLASAFDKADRLRVLLARGDSTVLDTIAVITPAAEEQSIRVEVGKELAGVDLVLSYELRAGTATLFSGTRTVRLKQGETTAAEAVLTPVASSMLVPDSLPALTAFGDTAHATAFAIFATGDTIPDTAITWNSLAAAVVTVDANGSIVARGNGIAQVTATIGSLRDTLQVRVQQVVTDVRVTAPDSLFSEFETSLEAVALDRRGSAVAGAGFAWSTSDSLVAQVDAAGLVTADARGTAIITAKSGGITASDTIRVVSVPTSSVQTGRLATCGLTPDGTAYCWGSNQNFMLGSTTLPVAGSTVPLQVPGGLHFKAISTGSDQVCALTDSGAAYCWGSNGDGALGSGSASGSPAATPTAVAGGHAFATISVGFRFTCGVTVAGEAYCWGSNSNGQLGTGGSSSPVPVRAGNTLYRTISAGFSHVCAVTVSRAVHCWGSNDNGELGRGTGGANSSVSAAISSGESFVSVAAGNDHSCAVTTKHTGLCWGANFGSQLGNGQSNGSSSQPVPLLTTARIVSIDAGEAHNCALAADGTYCWGGNWAAQLGVGLSHQHRNVPVLVGGSALHAVAAGGLTTCGVDNAGAAHCWGRIGHGLMGDGTSGYTRDPARVSTSEQFSSVATGIGGFTCGLTVQLVAFCWGDNWSGQTGTGSQNAGVEKLTPVPVSTGVRFTAITAGEFHACAIGTDSLAYCWGNNEVGQLGINSSAQRGLTPAPVASTVKFRRISAAAHHTCALAVTGAAYCWGSNEEGRLGDGTTAQRRAPQQVAGSQTFVAIGTAGNHSCALTAAGVAYCWGTNQAGELGNGTTVNSVVPVPVAGGITFQKIVLGGNPMEWGTLDDGFTCGLGTDGITRCWGSSSSCKTGAGNCNPGSQPFPAPVNGGLRFVDLTAGRLSACGRIADGSAYCWGNNFEFTMGGSVGDFASSPTPATAGMKWQALSVGGTHACGINDGAVYCWGDRNWGATGEGTSGYRLTRVPAASGMIFRQ